jgi:hypothetical protein
MVGDIDRDGRADVLALFPEGAGIIDLARSSTLGKPRFPMQARREFGRDLLVGVCGKFTGKNDTEVLAVAKDGSLHLAYQASPEGRFTRSRSFSATDVRLPDPPILAITLPSSTSSDSVLVVDKKGNLLRLTPRTGGEGFDSQRLRGRLSSVQEIAIQPDGAAFFWTDNKGTLHRATVAGENIETKQVLRGTSGEKLAVGKFSGTAEFDVLLGQRLLPGGDPARATVLNTLPDTATQKGDFRWMTGDLDADGRDDLIRVRRSGETVVGDDVLVHFFRPASAPDNTASTSGDGLLDVWKTGQVKPGGLDLPALGCRVGRREVIVEIQRMENVTEDLVKREIQRAVDYFGRLGITLIPIYREPIPLSEGGKPWWELGQKYHPASHRGVTHWMLITNAGGGQSGEMEDRGSCGSRALYATFLHEFGHQLGLDHSGRWAPAWCPIYPSLMNYAYSYQLGGKADEIGYSDGRLTSIIFNEQKLSERLPLPMEKVAFLAGPPYRYRLQPTPDGKETLIDWNWNGVFGESGVSADINYGYSTTGGLRHTIGKSYIAPVPVSHGKGRNARLLLFSGQLSEGASVPPSDSAVEKRSLSSDMPGRLMVRLWDGKKATKDGDSWTTDVTVAPDGVIGDASAVSLGDTTWVAYPTAAGVELRPVTFNKTIQVGEKTLLPETTGTQPTLAAVDGRLALLLWRDEKTPVGFRLLRVRGTDVEVGPESALPFTSRTPVGAVAGAKEKGQPSLWVGLFQDRDKDRTWCGQIRSFALQKDGTLSPRTQEWVGNEQSGQRGQTRPVLLWKEDKSLRERGGQLWFLAAGLFGNDRPWACHYVSIRIADTNVNGGWLQRRYYDEWTQSRSAPGACFFRDEMIFASRWYGNVRGTENDNLFVAFYGRGYESEPMGDFDDITFIRDIGLSHSILYRAE